ncbi:uncharacterized protein [Coffea arabica]|uniref:G-patch domain-containing protein n=1 Tax=Coffea arabica TaxID=13443 RepID=A0ABM4WN00_COFAR
MNIQPESSDKTTATTQPEVTSPGVQLAELLAKFGEMASEMATQKKLIDELVSSGVQPELPRVIQLQSEPFVIPTVQTTDPMQGPPEGTFTYPTIHLPYTYSPNPSFFPTHMQGPQPQVTANIPPETQAFYYPTTEPYLPDHFIQTKPEVGGSSAPIDVKLLKRLDRFDEFMRKSQAAGKIGTVPPPTYPYGMPAWYNPQAVCAYHSGAPGHATFDCKALKHKIQDMVEAGEIVIRKREAQGPNVNRNPLPDHVNTIGVIMDDTEYMEQFKDLAREAEVFGVTDQPFIIELPFEEDNQPFVLDLTPAESEALKPVFIEFPRQEPVLSLQQVPWNYDEPIIQIGENSTTKKEVSVITRSGRTVSPFETTIPIQAKNSEPPIKPTITEKEAVDFLKRLQRSEYNIIEKLSKSPAQITMLDLLFSSDVHRDALIDVLTKAQIPRDISVDNFSNVVGSVLFNKQIVFSDDELPTEGIGHNRALYITVRPWIHKSGAVPSSLHQLLKFVVNDKLITIFAEEDCLVITDSGVKKEGSQSVTMSPHSTSDIVSVSWITTEEQTLSKASVMMAREMIRGGYKFDKGLGRELQGILKPVKIVEKRDTFGLGFQPTAKDIKEMKERKRAEKEGRQRVFDIPPPWVNF